MKKWIALVMFIYWFIIAGFVLPYLLSAKDDFLVVVGFLVALLSLIATMQIVTKPIIKFINENN